MRGITDNSTNLSSEVIRLAETRGVLLTRLELVLTALALSADAQALAQQRLDGVGANGRAGYAETPADLERAAQHYRQILSELSLRVPDRHRKHRF